MLARCALRRARRDSFSADFACFFVICADRFILASHARLAASRACSTRGATISRVLARAESTAGAIRSAARPAASDAADLK
jgi:hypothetical protein